MKITIIGTGYVGSVTNTYLAELGDDVFCLDVDQAKIDRLNSPGFPIHEPGLDDVVSRSRANGGITFSTYLTAAGHLEHFGKSLSKKLAAYDSCNCVEPNVMSVGGLNHLHIGRSMSTQG